MMNNKNNNLFQQLRDELALSGFALDESLTKVGTTNDISVLEGELLKRVSGGRHEKTNADGSTSTVFIKGAGVTF